MGCSSCSSGGGCSTTGGCGKSGGCSSGGCNKMNTFDWLGNMEPTRAYSFKIAEIRFKGGRKEYFRNVNDIELNNGDPVIVNVPNGHHLGFVSLQGELVRLQMKKKNIVEDDQIRDIYRIANAKDIEKFDNTQKRELPTLFRTREIINELKLDMKLTDVEYQADNTKATFYYSADDRVDFRELIKCLATEFKIRVEMRQISLRQEAGRLGGIGSCGRELCCSTWLSDFKSVSTSAARYQNLSLNPSKLSGQCGRLKCCLNYELDTYVDALKDIPTVEDPLLTERGEAYLQKTDIFKKIMWFGYREDTTWYPLSVDRVNAILELNKKGVSPASLDEHDTSLQDEKEKAEDDLNELKRLDEKYKKKKKKKKKPKGPNTVNASGSVEGETSVPGQEKKSQQERRPQAQKQHQHPNKENREKNSHPNREKGPSPQNNQREKQPQREHQNAPRENQNRGGQNVPRENQNRPKGNPNQQHKGNPNNPKGNPNQLKGPNPPKGGGNPNKQGPDQKNTNNNPNSTPDKQI
ncbi:regulatory iron-sulfur-containing complex subunit RicT [Sporocytophaga myxococcoides]|uniref:regulatory iron-sulfur-containing complex subunit RicT n=1 Tax=Sporocytophaga myxococcoides TaxID=153721 RepID=UPI000411A5C0|nr:regulatory iron-sulfur-containing complex subunit RicT [Sporocytophaga myxococcoides]